MSSVTLTGDSLIKSREIVDLTLKHVTKHVTNHVTGHVTPRRKDQTYLLGTVQLIVLRERIQNIRLKENKEIEGGGRKLRQTVQWYDAYFFRSFFIIMALGAFITLNFSTWSMASYCGLYVKEHRYWAFELQSFGLFLI